MMINIELNSFRWELYSIIVFPICRFLYYYPYYVLVLTIGTVPQILHQQRTPPSSPLASGHSTTCYEEESKWIVSSTKDCFLSVKNTFLYMMILLNRCILVPEQGSSKWYLMDTSNTHDEVYNNHSSSSIEMMIYATILWPLLFMFISTQIFIKWVKRNWFRY